MGMVFLGVLVFGSVVVSSIFSNNAPASPWSPVYFLLGVCGVGLCYGNSQGWFDSSGEQGSGQAGSQVKFQPGQTQGDHQQHQTRDLVTQNQDQEGTNKNEK